ncbi:MAG: transcriptional repressor LexA [Bacillota bacterium]
MRKNSEEKMYEILEFVTSEAKKNGYPPTVREICKAVELNSTSTVHSYLKKLEDKDLIRKESSNSRAIQVNPSKNQNFDPSLLPAREMIEVPVLGRVAAGQPILAQEDIEETFPVPIDFLNGAEGFMLRVKGDSMIEAGILDRDFVLVRSQPTASNGDIVVAIIEDEATVKTYYKEKDHIRLQPENSSLEPIIVRDVILAGKVTGVFRRL